MSSVVVLCPNGHRQKVSTTPNMSILQVLETVCTKKGFDPARHKLQHHRKFLDLSTTVRFSGLPNNALLELVEVGEEEGGHASNAPVSVCLQVPSGERLIGEFPPTSTLEQVLAKWRDQLGQPEQGEEPVVVYMRREVVGEGELGATTLRTLGLTSGRGLFRFFFKKPEVLKDQAKVYDMKQAERPESEAREEKRHLPMRLEPARLVLPEQKEDSSESTPSASVSVATAETAAETPTATAAIDDELQPSSSRVADSQLSSSSAAVGGAVAPDSTSTVQVAAVINPVGPGEAIVFPVEGMEAGASKYELDDDFFELKLDDVKGLYKELRVAAREMQEGGVLLTREMREAQKEGEKLALLSRYRSTVIRIQFPSRHVVQGVFSPGTTIGEVSAWLEPLLSSPSSPFQLYTAPPRAVLDPLATLLDLGLCPAALIHFSGSGSSDFLKAEAIENLSNIQGANEAASQHRKGGKRPETGVKDPGVMQCERGLSTVEENPTESRLGKRSGGEEPVARTAGGGQKMPRWFKPGK